MFQMIKRQGLSKIIARLEDEFSFRTRVYNPENNETIRISKTELSAPPSRESMAFSIAKGTEVIDLYENMTYFRRLLNKHTLGFQVAGIASKEAYTYFRRWVKEVNDFQHGVNEKEAEFLNSKSTEYGHCIELLMPIFDMSVIYWSLDSKDKLNDDLSHDTKIVINDVSAVAVHLYKEEGPNQYARQLVKGASDHPLFGDNVIGRFDVMKSLPPSKGMSFKEEYLLLEKLINSVSD